MLDLDSIPLKSFVMKREREPACPVCFHYHKWEQGEVCKTCGHRPSTPSERREPASTFPSEILPEFLYLGSYDNASRNELLKAVRVSGFRTFKLLDESRHDCLVSFRNSSF